MRIFFPKSFTNKCTQHGEKYEKEALQAFAKRNPAYKITTPGFIISEKLFWLGVSPDGIIYNQGKPTKLLEIKCPFIGLMLYYCIILYF